ncbi:DNA-binding ATP-dependent protease La [Desulfamplus magnetovallimortis]|uniref:Lon protease n=1 Tax=Desulfamplus magnetovallimortis TaxID=1246637 RepID=A0A1W1HCZ4_9BACT|nr:endopeptidase La [Desulfamplus magnetovallimortis]SLM30262.1 DNA-binding ATP-dependent protease La [Desulfamplus magnetovallimortis]
MINLSKLFNYDDAISDPEELPLLPLRDLVLFPHMTAPVFVGRSKSINALSRAMTQDKRIFLVTQKHPEVVKPKISDIYLTGTEASITQILRLPDGTVKALVEGLRRGKINSIHGHENESYATVRFQPINDDQFILDKSRAEAAIRTVTEAFQKYAKHSGSIPKSMLQNIEILSREHSKFADIIASHMPFKLNDKQTLLEAVDLEDRFLLLLRLIEEEIEVLAMSQKIKVRVKEQMEKLQKRHYLTEQMRAIKKEMGEDEQQSKTTQEFQELEKKIKRKRLPKEASSVVRTELDKFGKMSPMSSEATVVRNYIECILSLPWYRKSRKKINIDEAESILNRDHYGLEKPKERILEYLAVQVLVKKIRGPVLCLVGPPGVGKTSLAKSVATSMGRSFARISLGGVRDEAEIRGHRRTYIGAMPGKIIQTLRKTGFNNPVFCLDEVDKMSTDFRGDPSSALLEVLDPEQNQSFNDHYLDIEYDLSDILFITTANTLHDIPAPLQDRMEVIRIPGYTENEKEQIAHGYLIPRQMEQNGMNKDLGCFTKDAVISIIRQYTREAGVRNLEREISSVLRKVARKIVQTGERKPYTITPESLVKYLGKPRFRNGVLEKEDRVGIVNGLAWTQVGGELLIIETVTMKGKGAVSVTGKLGEVMKESASAAVSYVRSRSAALGIREDFYKDLDIHIHVPEGAIPKDGPSAGIAMCTAVISVLSNRPVMRKTAMTGEITLRGRVLPVGGLKEKLIAAHASGIKRVIISKDNEKDISDLPDSIQKALDIVLVEDMEEVLEMSLVQSPKKPDEKKKSPGEKKKSPDEKKRSPDEKKRSPDEKKLDFNHMTEDISEHMTEDISEQESCNASSKESCNAASKESSSATIKESLNAMLTERDFISA